MAGPQKRILQKATVLIAKGPTAAPEWTEITISVGLLARWEMEGPARDDGTYRVVSDFLLNSRHCDRSWLVWAALAPSDTFKDWLLNILDFEWVGDGEDLEDVE